MNGPTVELAVDFETAGTVEVGSAAELRDLLASRGADAPRVRLCGTGTRQRELPAPDGVPTMISLAPMSKITRFDAEDLTCSVEPGVRRADLDAALGEKGLRLPCAPTRGTLGGLFALGREAWPDAPGTLGESGARGMLLGLSAVLAEGKAFKAGAKVVKSVAGFDLHKLFVGSRGQLFAATELHLKLRPAPRSASAFALEDLEADRALALFRALRLDDYPPASVRMLRRASGSGLTVAGRFEGSARIVSDRMRAHDLTAVPSEPRDLDGTAALERVIGLVAPSRLPELLARLPADAPFRVGGTGVFEAFMPAVESDALLPALPGCGVSAELDLAPPDRRGRATPRDPGAARLEERLKAELDPGSVLT